MLALALLSGPMVANAAHADVLLATWGLGDTMGNGGSGATDLPPQSGGGIGLFFLNGPDGGINGGTPDFSSCIGCYTNLGIGTLSNVTFDYTSQNTPNFNAFVTRLTTTTDALYTLAVRFDASTGQPTFEGGMGAPIGGSTGIYLTSPNVVASIDEVQEHIINYSFSSNPYIQSVQFTWSIYGTPGPDFSGPYPAAPVPLPASAWLMLSALGGFGIFGRRRA